MVHAVHYRHSADVSSPTALLVARSRRLDVIIPVLDRASWSALVGAVLALALPFFLTAGLGLTVAGALTVAVALALTFSGLSLILRGLCLTAECRQESIIDQIAAGA